MLPDFHCKTWVIPLHPFYFQHIVQISAKKALSYLRRLFWCLFCRLFSLQIVNYVSILAELEFYNDYSSKWRVTYKERLFSLNAWPFITQWENAKLPSLYHS